MKPNNLKLNKVSLLKCDACGGYHPEDECEVVTIKLIKGKSCEFKPTFFSAPIQNNEVYPQNIGNNTVPLGTPAPETVNMEPKPLVKQKKIIPPGMKDIMTPPADVIISP
jgi:hypothetical protein